jgi:hypothetical protein
VVDSLPAASSTWSRSRSRPDFFPSPITAHTPPFSFLFLLSCFGGGSAPVEIEAAAALVPHRGYARRIRRTTTAALPLPGGSGALDECPAVDLDRGGPQQAPATAGRGRTCRAPAAATGAGPVRPRAGRSEQPDQGVCADDPGSSGVFFFSFSFS